MVLDTLTDHLDGLDTDRVRLDQVRAWHGQASNGEISSTAWRRLGEILSGDVSR